MNSQLQKHFCFAIINKLKRFDFDLGIISVENINSIILTCSSLFCMKQEASDKFGGVTVAPNKTKQLEYRLRSKGGLCRKIPALIKRSV